MGQLSLTAILLVTMATSLTACPVRECSCNMGDQGPVIDCENKNFDLVPEFLDDTTEYYELKLSGNNINIIPGKAFKKLKVKRIDLGDNPIRKISPIAFEGLETTLKELILGAKSDTPVKFPNTLLYSLTALQTVKLKGFDMPVLEYGLFLYSKNLVQLTLEDCKIITVFPTAFAGLEGNLTLLDLSNNRMTSVPVPELMPLRNLRKLVLAQNRITTLQHYSFQNMTKLVDLDLSQNSIQKIESAAFAGMETTLEYLGLHANMLSQTSLIALANLAKLEQLNLAYNLFMNTLPENIFKNLRKLAYLNLQGNRLTSISPATFEGLSDSLSVLILSENKLSSLPDEGFRHLGTLKWLYLDLMQLGGTLTQHTFHGLENSLEYLTLEGVRFVNDDWNSVHYLHTLKSMNLCQNEITQIPKDTFVNMPGLEQLMLCHNKIENITQENMHGLEDKLQLLNLEGNGVKTMDQCSLKDFVKLQQLNLDGNPLVCDCRLRWLRQWVERQTDAIKMMIGWKCASPEQHLDRLLKMIPVDDLQCSSSVNITCLSLPKPTSSPVPHAHIKAATVTDRSVAVRWNLDFQDSVLGLRLFYRMTENETFAFTLLLNPMLREYVIHELDSTTNYTICIGLDLKVGQVLPEEECINVTTSSEQVSSTHITESTHANTGVMMIVGSAAACVVILAVLGCGVVMVVRWRRKTRLAKESLYDTPWSCGRPQAPSLSTLPSRRSDFENPMRHYYSRPLSTGTIATVSSNMPRSHSMAVMLDAEYSCDRKKRTKSMDELAPVYDLDRCVYKIDKMMASASNLLVHHPPRNFSTDIPPPQYSETNGISPDIPPYPAEVSNYPEHPQACQIYGRRDTIQVRREPVYDGRDTMYGRREAAYDGRDTMYGRREPVYGRRDQYQYDQTGAYPGTIMYAPHTHSCSDYSPPTNRRSLPDRDSGHMSGFPSYTSGFDELEPPPVEHVPRCRRDPLPPPPPAYLLEGATETDSQDYKHIYDEIYTLY